MGWVTDIADFEVAADGSYFVYVNNALWKSKDTGQNWIKISNKFPSGFGNIEAHRDGKLFLLVTGDEPYILRSLNYGENWDTLYLKFSDPYRMRNYLVNPYNSDMILLYGSKSACKISVDGGNIWKDIQFVTWGALENPIIYQHNTATILGIWWLNPPEYSYYESLDTGRTWDKRNLSTIIYPDSYSSDNRIYHDSSGLMIKTILNNLYISQDFGKHINLISDLYGWDAVKPSINILGSILVDGLMESNDTGATWKTFRGSRQFPGFSGIELSILSKDTMFALTHEIYYAEGKPRSADLLMQSNDGGQHWFDLLKAENVGVLKSGSFPESKYYFISDSHSLVCGRPGQTVPDTLLTTVGDMVQFEISKPYPMDMYVMVNQNGGFSYFFTTDAGATWTRLPVPPYLYDEVVLYPSLIERGKFFAVTHSPNPLDIYGLGLWVVQNYGERWELTWSTPDLFGSLIRLTGNDKIFNVSLNKFSSDDGRTWVTDTTGMEGNDWSDFVHNDYGRYATSRGLVIAYNKAWYLYTKSGWMKLRDERGDPISRTLPAPSAIDFAGNYLYCGREFTGLYRIPVSNITSVQEPRKNVDLEDVIAYPNPFAGYTTISYRLHAPSAQLRIVDILGRTVYRELLPTPEGAVAWDGKTGDGEPLPDGVYLVTIMSKGKALVCRRVLRTR